MVRLRDLLRARGYRSDIFYGNASADRLDHGFPVSRLGDHSSVDRVLLYQLSIGSGVGDIFRERTERKFVNYHNITPADLLEAWVPQVGEEVRWGRAQLARPRAGHRVRGRGLAFQRARAPGSRLPRDGDGAVAHRSRGFRRFAGPGHCRAPAAGQGLRWDRFALRREGLASQGPTRPGQSARRLPTLSTTTGLGCASSVARSATATSPPSSVSPRSSISSMRSTSRGR